MASTKRRSALSLKIPTGEYPDWIPRWKPYAISRIVNRMLGHPLSGHWPDQCIVRILENGARYEIGQMSSTPGPREPTMSHSR